jgi:hypothetical protein
MRPLRKLEAQLERLSSAEAAAVLSIVAAGGGDHSLLIQRIEEGKMHPAELLAVKDGLAGKLSFLCAPVEGGRDIDIYIFIDDLLEKGTKETFAIEDASKHFNLGKTMTRRIFKRWDHYFSVLMDQDYDFLRYFIDEPAHAFELMNFVWFLTNEKVTAVLPKHIEK